MRSTRPYFLAAITVATAITLTACADGSSGMGGMDMGSSLEPISAPAESDPGTVTA